MSDQFRTPADAAVFRETVSQWQLAARTEVKRSSSLPSSMFGACDPMLEARLAESVEAMMNCLHLPGMPESDSEVPVNPSDMRVETVAPEELQKLPHLVPAVAPELDLERGISAEYLSLLIDTCTTGDGATKSAARALLQQDFAIAATADLEQATQALYQCMQRLDRDDKAEATSDKRLVDLCGAIAASVIIATQEERSQS